MRNFLLSGLALFLFARCTNYRPEPRNDLEGKPLPSFDILLIDGITHQNIMNSPAGKSIVILYISSECPFCKAQTEEIVANIKDAKGIHFFFLGNEPMENFKIYAERHTLNKLSSITVAQDYDYGVRKYFNITNIPFVAVYDKNRKLKKVFNGKVDASLIIRTAIE